MIFLIYLHSRQVMNHSIKQLVLLYQVYSHSLSSTDVPFTNGQFTRGVYTGSDCSYCKPAFYSLSCSGITSDSGLFLIIHFIHSLYKSQKQNQIRLFISKFFWSCFHYNTLILPTQSQYQKSQNPHHHTPQSITISKKSKSPSSHSPNHSISLPSFLTHTNLPLSCRN